MQFYVMTRTHVRQFTLVHGAKCMPMTGFKATVCASTRDNHTTVPLPDGGQAHVHTHTHTGVCVYIYIYVYILYYIV